MHVLKKTFDTADKTFSWALISSNIFVLFLHRQTYNNFPYENWNDINCAKNIKMYLCFSFMSVAKNIQYFRADTTKLHAICLLEFILLNMKTQTPFKLQRRIVRSDNIYFISTCININTEWQSVVMSLFQLTHKVYINCNAFPPTHNLMGFSLGVVLLCMKAKKATQHLGLSESIFLTIMVIMHCFISFGTAMIVHLRKN